MIWLVFALMILATIAALVVPLWRGRGRGLSRAEYDLTVYRDQLAEIDRELERGTLKPAQADAARVEIQRRILSLDEGLKAGPKEAATGRPYALIAGIAIVVPLVAVLMYGRLGAPYLPDRPYAQRADQIKEAKDQAQMIRGMIMQLTAKLEQNPADGKGWAMLGRSLKVTGQVEKSIEAYRKAVPLLPGDIAVRMEFAGILLDELPQGMPLPTELAGLMEQVLAIDASNIDALYFLGISAAQSGDKAKAKSLWKKAADLLPADSADRADILKQIETLN